MFFQTAQPLGKEEFLSVYKDAVLLTQLLFAPFGLADESVNILGQKNATDSYTTMFQQYEDIVSKRIFAIRGHDDDRIIASMHEYVGQNQDAQVVQEMQAANAALHNMLLPPSAVLFDFSSVVGYPSEHNPVTARTAALLLRRVLTSLVPALYGADPQLLQGEYCTGTTSLYSGDQEALSALGARIPLSEFSPTCALSKAPFNSCSLRCRAAVEGLLSSLTVSLADLSSAAAVSSMPVPVPYSANEVVVQFSLQQYHCLLDMFGDSAEVQAVLANFLQGGDGAQCADQSTAPTVKAVRDGLFLGSLNLSAHPTVCYINQLASKRSALAVQVAETREKSAAADQGAALEELELRAVEVTDLLELAQLSVERRAAAQEKAQAGELKEAVSLLTDELLDLVDPLLDERGEDEADQDAEVLLPVHIRASLWTERATYQSDAGDLDCALRDINRAIALRSLLPAAYALRSKLRMETLADKLCDPEEEQQKTEAAAAVDEAERAELLQQAAEDGLLAFLLAGSTDLGMAAAAEEAAREACRLSAKTIFRDRKQSERVESAEESSQPDNLPRSWLVGSYFGAYEPLSSALSVYCDAAFSEATNTEHESTESSDIDSTDCPEVSDNLCDIDEGDSSVLPLPAAPKHLQNCGSSCPADSEAYALLVCLVELMEAVSYDSEVNARSSNVSMSGIQATPAESACAAKPVEVAEIAIVRHRDVCITRLDTGVTRKVNRSVAANLLAFAESAGVQSLAQAMVGLELEPGSASKPSEGTVPSHACFEVVGSGVCEIRGDTEVSGSSEIQAGSEAPAVAPESEAVQVESCRHYRAALDLLRGCGWSLSSDTAAVPEYMRSAVGGLSADAVAALTGVRFNADGSVLSVEAVAGPAGELAEDDADSSAGNSSDNSSRGDEDSEEDQYDYERQGYGGSSNPMQDFLRQAFGFGGDAESSGGSEGEEDEESDWETVDSSDEDEDCSESEEDEENEVQKPQPAVARKVQESVQKPKPATSAVGVDRAAEVAAALQEVEAQMERHHLEEQAPLPTPPPSSSKDNASAAPVSHPVGAVMPVSNNPLPPTPPVAAVQSTPQVESVQPAPQVCTPTGAAAKSLTVSHRLRARLLSVCASMAYLAGDATGAVRCLRASMQQDPRLLDSQVKLGSLLVDMDEMSEASKLLKSAHKKAPTDHIALLHLAELHTHASKFDEAVHLLRKARRITESALNSLESGSSDDESLSANTARIAAAREAVLCGSSADADAKRAAMAQEYSRRAKRACAESLANVISLLGINLFRQLPSRPEVALHLLQDALSMQFAERASPILLLCCGEVYSQAGDMVTALECFQKAQRIAPNNPLSYVNAARTYQQLNQIATAERHLNAALLLDPAMAMVRVDLAQNLLMTGKAAQALGLLDEALLLAKQVSEIRDVLTARAIATMQVSLEERGLYCSSGARSLIS